MKKILILGGYGGFGSLLSAELDRRGFQVIMAGRNVDKAEELCITLQSATATRADRNENIEQVLLDQRPDLLIDAAGPFQIGGHKVIQACLATQTPYLDLADAREFVGKVGQFDTHAKEARIPIISGASSVPALSGAAIRHLADDTDRIDAIEMAISASNKATAGPSVTKAILSYVGKPIRVWTGGFWKNEYGWQMIKPVRFKLSDGSVALKRMVALAEVPDLELIPEQYASRPSVLFRAGTELWFQNIALWLASWLVRWGWVKSLISLAPMLMRLQKLTQSMGSDVSAMKVRLFGRNAQTRFEKQWTLIAQNGDGPRIPTFAAILLAGKILGGQMQPGSYDASRLLSLTDFQPHFDRYAITHESVTENIGNALYEHVMGASFSDLPLVVRSLHDGARISGYVGKATVKTGPNPLAKFAAWIFGFPPAGDHDLTVQIAADENGERWTRSFSGKRFSSHLQMSGPYLAERFGPFRFLFKLPVSENGLQMVMAGWKLGPIPLPLFLAPKSLATEWQEEGRFHFDVPISFPLVGLMVHYRGWLDVPVD